MELIYSNCPHVTRIWHRGWKCWVCQSCGKEVPHGL